MRCLPKGLILFCTVAAIACAAEPKPEQKVDQKELRDKVSKIALCRTTEAELLSQLGPAMRDGRLGEFRVRSWLLGKDPERILGVLLSAQGTVVDIAWDIPGVANWVPQSRCPPAQ